MPDDSLPLDGAASPSEQMHELELKDWDAVRIAFRNLFAGLGEIGADEAGIIFASMPLHGIDGKVDRIPWDAALTRVEFLGEGIAYTYRIPEVLLRKR